VTTRSLARARRPSDLAPTTRCRASGRIRRRTLLLLVCALYAGHAGPAAAAALPITLQASLLAKVANYDRNFRKRAGDRVRIFLVTRAGHADSAAAAAQMAAALGRVPNIAGLPHDEFTHTYTRADALAESCKARRIAVVVLGPGFEEDIEVIRRALDGLEVLTVSTVPDYVPRGVVLGFDVVSGKPRILVHLPQAKRQQVQFRADALSLMQVYK
jgi:hypothetical protein